MTLYKISKILLSMVCKKRITKTLKNKSRINFPKINHFSLAFLAILLLSCTSGKSESTAELYSCTQDKDCVLVSKDCCPCSHGGEYIAINKTKEKSYENKRKAQCPALACPAWFRCGEWEDKARCINSQCSAIKKKR